MTENENVASINVTRNQRRINPPNDWYYNGGSLITFTQGNTPNTRIYGTASETNVIGNTTVQTRFYGRVTLRSRTRFNYHLTVYNWDGSSSESENTSSDVYVDNFDVESGFVRASDLTIVNGNYDEERIYSAINIPIFREGDTESINNYLNTGDYSNALNQRLLDGSMCDIYLTNNGDRIEFNTVPQKDEAKELLYTHIVVNLGAPNNSSFNIPPTGKYTTSWSGLINNPIQVQININSIDIFDGDHVVASFKNVTLTRKALGFFGSVSVSPSHAESNGYNLFTTTDNSFDDVGENSEDDSDATDNNEDGSSFGGFSNLTCTYKISKTALSDLGNFIWKNSIFDDIKLINNSPIENIVSCHYMPCSIGGSNATIVLGNIETNVSGTKLSQNMTKVNVASFTMPKVNTGFLGYEPYTSVSLYLPLVGMIELQPKDVCGYNVSIDYVFDVVCGSFGVMVYTSKGGGKTMLYSSHGTCNVTIPLTSSNNAQVQSALLQSGVSLIGNSVAKDVGGVVSDSINMLTTQNHSNTFGSPSSMVGALSPQYCYYIIRTPIISLPNNFAHTKGYICMSTYKLGELKGFTKLSSDVDLSGFECTESELERLRSILTSGFYM